MPTSITTIIVAHLGADPEVKVTANEKLITKLRLWTKYRQKNQAGEWEDHFQWYSAVVGGKAGEWIARDAKKGSVVHLVSTDSKVRTYQAKDGTAKAEIDLGFCDRAICLDRKESLATGAAPTGQERARVPGAAQPVAKAGGESEAEPPF